MILAGPDFKPPPVMELPQLLTLVLSVYVATVVQADYPSNDIIFTSWYRDPARNAEVGGVSNSLHQVGLAIDMAPKASLLRTIAAFGTDAGSMRQGLSMGWRKFGLDSLIEEDHTHVEFQAR